MPGPLGCDGIRPRGVCLVVAATVGQRYDSGVIALLFLLLSGAFVLTLLLFALAFAAVSVGALPVLVLMFLFAATVRRIIHH